MNVREMTKLAIEAHNAGQKMTLVLPAPWKGRPKGFPRGELLCEQIGSSVYHFDPMKILNWLHKNGLIVAKVAEGNGEFVLSAYREQQGGEA